MHVLITAGPTREPIDDVRFITNRSSGRMGWSLAQAAATAGHEVTLLWGAGNPLPGTIDGVQVERFERTAELQALMHLHFGDCDVLIMAAAVADYIPRQVEGKLTRSKGEPLTLTLDPTPDLVAELAKLKRPDQRIVAFALEEPAQLLSRAREKMIRKGVDAIVANPIQTLDSGLIEAHYLTVSGSVEQQQSMKKDDFASWLIRKVCEPANAQTGSA